MDTPIENGTRHAWRTRNNDSRTHLSLGGDARCRVSLAGSSFDKLNIGLSKDVMVSLSNHESELTRYRTP